MRERRRRDVWGRTVVYVRVSVVACDRGTPRTLKRTRAWEYIARLRWRASFFVISMSWEVYGMLTVLRTS
jgi:hypothetical protein